MNGGKSERMCAWTAPAVRRNGVGLSSTLIALAVLAGCTMLPRSATPHTSGDADIYNRSTQPLAAPPEKAGACIVENARRAGHTAELVPLYGLESVAVTVKTALTGDVLAVLSLTRAHTGASAAVTTMTGAVKDRGELIKSLVQGC
jgi:hypothetical protein